LWTCQNNHERVSTQAILRVFAPQDVQLDLFANPRQSYAEAVQFYKYDVDWAIHFSFKK